MSSNPTPSPSRYRSADTFHRKIHLTTAIAWALCLNVALTKAPFPETLRDLLTVVLALITAALTSLTIATLVQIFWTEKPALVATTLVTATFLSLAVLKLLLSVKDLTTVLGDSGPPAIWIHLALLTAITSAILAAPVIMEASMSGPTKKPKAPGDNGH